MTSIAAVAANMMYTIVVSHMYVSIYSHMSVSVYMCADKSTQMKCRCSAYRDGVNVDTVNVLARHGEPAAQNKAKTLECVQYNRKRMCRRN
jgi:hypothetical protein